jgi:hypothetical protein
MALENIPTIGPGALNANLDKVVVYKNGGSEAAVSLLTLTNSALSLSGVYLDAVNQRIGVGTPSPTDKLSVVSGSSSVASFIGFSTPTNYKSEISIGDTANSRGFTIGIDPYQTGNDALYFYDSKTAHLPVAIKDQTLIIGNYDVDLPAGMDTATGLYMRVVRQAIFRTSGGNPILKLATDGTTQLGNETAMNARLGIKGSGSTSATTSLLVQNSAGIESLKVQDDNIVRTTYLGIGGGTSTNNIGGTHIAQFGNAVSSGDQLIVVDSVAGTKRGFKFGNQGTIRMALIQDGVNLQIGNFVSTFNPYVTFEYVTGNVGFGTASTNSSAKVQIDSTTQGFLKPRLTTAQKNAIVTPAAGLEVYDTDLNRPCFYNGTSWITL